MASRTTSPKSALLHRHRPGVLAYLRHEIPQRLRPPRVADGDPVPRPREELAAVAPMFPAPMIPMSTHTSRSSSRRAHIHVSLLSSSCLSIKRPWVLGIIG